METGLFLLPRREKDLENRSKGMGFWGTIYFLTLHFTTSVGRGTAKASKKKNLLEGSVNDDEINQRKGNGLDF